MKRRPAPDPMPGELPASLAECVVEDWLEPGELPEGPLNADDRERLEIIAWGHLVDQFLSPVLNRRDDRYGGNVENRCRFALEVFQAVLRAGAGLFAASEDVSASEFRAFARRVELTRRSGAWPGWPVRRMMRTVSFLSS